MSLRELARKYLEQKSRSRCPVPGLIGMSGPDKMAKPHISLGVALVRTPDVIRTNLPRPDSPSGSDSVNRPDKPDASDSPDKSDKSTVAAEWWTSPVDGWPHTLTIRNISTDKETIIDLTRALTSEHDHAG